jgi:hypothetical protein
MSSIKKFVVYTIAVLILPLAVSSESLPDDAKPVRGSMRTAIVYTTNF